MSVKSCEKLDKSKVALTIEADAAAFEAAINKAYLQQRSKISVPGFRPGKAPRKMIESMYGAEVFYEEAVNILLPDAYEAAVKEQELKVVGYPEVELESCGKDGVVFKCTVAVYPEVTLGQYKGLEAPKAEVNVTDEDVDNRLNEMADRNSRLVSVEREIQKGDTADIDFEGFDNGVPFDGGKAENYPLLLGSGMFIDGFEEQVAGIRPEEEREIHVTFPQQYTPELAGKAAVFRVQAHRIVRRSMPELNDEFARAQGFSDAAALRQAIMSAALQRKEAQARDAYADALVRQVLDGMEVRVPDSMVESQLTGLLHELESRLMSQGASLSDYLQMAGMTEEDLRAHARENALESARYELAMTEIARLEHIRVTDEDVERRYQEMSRQFGVPVEHIRQQLPPMQLSHDLKLAYARAVVVDSGVRL